MRLQSGQVILAAVLMAAAARAQQDDAPLGLTDLAAEHEALAGKVDVGSPPRPATFRSLWERPDEFRGRRVRVEGRVVRTFRQDAVGSFPALVEAWVEQPPGDLLCVVFPAKGPDGGVASGASVAFVGVYLRRVRYKAEGDRLAPLIVGDAPPEVIAAPTGEEIDPAPKPPHWPTPFATVGLIAGLSAVAGLLAWRNMTAPAGRPRRGRRRGPRPEPGPAPEFLEPEADDGDRR